MKRLSRGALMLAAFSAVAATSAVATTSARAQSLVDQKQVTVKAGISAPTKNNVRSAGSTWLMGGVEYAFNSQDARRVGSVEVDYTAASDTHTPAQSQDIRERYRVWSLMYNYKFRRVQPYQNSPDKVLFYGAGIGADIIRAQVTDPNPGGEGDVDKRSTVGAGNLFVGYEFASNFQLEARYHIGFGSVADRKMNSIQLLAGLRF